MTQLVYVSYTRADAKFALRLRSDLLAAGVSLTSDRHNPGVRWRDAIASASHVIACFSSSGSADDELDLALQRTLLPVRLTPCDLPPSIEGITAVDLFDDWPAGLAQLIAALPTIAAEPTGPHQEIDLDVLRVGGDAVFKNKKGSGSGVAKSTLKAREVTVDGSFSVTNTES
jgi:TIR domain-containing protein